MRCSVRGCPHDAWAEADKCRNHLEEQANEHVNHPQHYGGGENPYEAIKVIEAWDLGFSLGNCIKYICRNGKKAGATDNGLRDLKKARWYLDREIQNREKV